MMKKIQGMTMLLAVLAALPACKSGDSGAGGGGGTGGSTSTGTTTGTGCDACWPQCFLDMFEPCMPSGACTQQTDGTTTVNACYGNGVKVGTVLGATGASLTYYKSDGSVCFTAGSAYSSTDVTATYKDANGATLLTDTTPLAGSQVQTIVCGGQTYKVDPSSAACQACKMGGGTSDCTDGACTVP